MSAGKFNVSYSALAQMALLPAPEKAALTRLFSSNDVNLPANTAPTADGRFVSRLGDKRVLWRRSAKKKPEIISIVDRSYAQA
ncbi:hypothetical protein [Sphingomonas oligoaromativorans]|uniref:hypothetical protein n=1 Tax=Sphingomonas oligoaromativorans TaxID=575322 RepID=UPI0014226309|nr:hypothetical protein [Sphingomonas oligoaromativorans]NIJ34085.1 hypothetical protein [Sphingomonas oligoaromativorans]